MKHISRRLSEKACREYRNGLRFRDCQSITLTFFGDRCRHRPLASPGGERDFVESPDGLSAAARLVESPSGLMAATCGLAFRAAPNTDVPPKYKGYFLMARKRERRGDHAPSRRPAVSRRWEARHPPLAKAAGFGLT